MLNPEGSLHGGCAAFLIDAYVLSTFFFSFPLPHHHSFLAHFLLSFVLVPFFFCAGWGIFLLIGGNRCTTLVFLAAARCAGVSASMNVVYHAPAAP
jgi:hypothetical protein